MERLLNKCLISGPCTQQVMGRVIFDFGMFFPEPAELGRCDSCPVLEAVEIIVLAKKERFLSHPLIEAYLKLKWYATWRIYVLILIVNVAYLVSVLGFACANYAYHDDGDGSLNRPAMFEGRRYRKSLIKITVFP